MKKKKKKKRRRRIWALIARPKVKPSLLPVSEAASLPLPHSLFCTNSTKLADFCDYVHTLPPTHSVLFNHL